MAQTSADSPASNAPSEPAQTAPQQSQPASNFLGNGAETTAAGQPGPAVPAPAAQAPAAPLTQPGLTQSGPTQSVPTQSGRGRRSQTANLPITAPALAPETAESPSSEGQTSQGQSSQPPARGAQQQKERSSQTRARDRAALRAYKELVDGNKAPAEPLPSRRALRQAQLEAERAPITSVNPVVPLPSQPLNAATTAPSAANAAGTVPAPPKTGQTTAGEQTPVVPAKPASVPSVAPAFTQSADHSATDGQGSGHQQADESAITTVQSKAAKSARRVGRRASSAQVDAPAVTASQPAIVDITSDSPGEPVAEQGLTPDSSDTAGIDSGDAVDWTNPHQDEDAPSQHQFSAQSSTAESLHDAQAAQPEVPEAENATADVVFSEGPVDLEVYAEAIKLPAPPPSHMPRATAGPPPIVEAPSEEELRRLAEEKAAAEREAILKQRAEARERLAQESAKSKKPQSDPTATNNLAMVTPLEFVEVPGADRPVLRPPSTTHVPIVTNTGSLASVRGGKSGNRGQKSPEAARFDAALAARKAANTPSSGDRSTTLKLAEELATVQPVETVTRTQMPPMPADYAHGLEPLDAVTAGLGRTQRNMIIQWGSLLVGAAAFVGGVVMLVSALAR